jgi:hypothetical protein
MFCFILCASLYGCATILNGSTQKVYIVAPEGTTIRDSGGISVPITNTITNTITNEHYITLKRNRDYVLRFENNGQELLAGVPRSLESGWIPLDIIFYIAPVFIDMGTNAWYSFDDLKVYFANDSLANQNKRVPYIESFERIAPFPKDLPKTPKIGGVFIAGGGIAMPVDQPPLFFNGYEIGAGYSLFSNLDLIVTASVAFDIEISIHSVYYGTNATSTLFSLETRYNFFGGVYGTAGGGLARITSDSLHTTQYSALAPINRQMGTIFAGIGYSGSLGFIELSFEMTTLNFGFNVHF